MKSDESINYIRSPRLLILCLLNRCNNKCRFCMVENEIQEANLMEFKDIQSLINTENIDTRIEFYGGEPTLHPRFFDAIAFAIKQGHECSIASNGRIFASDKYTNKLAKLGAKNIYVRTSLYGHNSKIHDYYTRSYGSFNQTIKGITNLLKHGFRCQVNFVIMKYNYRYLSDMVELVSNLGVPRVKFGMLVETSKNIDDAVRIRDLREPLHSAIEKSKINGLTVTIEKAPLCLAKDYLSCFSCADRQITKIIRHYSNNACFSCILTRWCDGVDPGYFENFGDSELSQINRVSKSALFPIDKNTIDIIEPEFLKTYFISYDLENSSDLEMLNKLNALKHRTDEKLGELVIIPPSLVD